MTDCKYGITICAEENGELDYECHDPTSKNIAGAHDSGLICLDFCEHHYAMVKEWIDK